MALLRNIANKRGLIILTDSDGAGFVIRNHLKGALPKDRVFHAYIPDIYGKERRKAAPGKEGKLGVEGMDPEIIKKALLEAGVEPDTGSSTNEDHICKADLYALGFSGRSDSKERRKKLLIKLQLPEHLSPNAMLDVLNILYSREEFLRECSCGEIV